MNPCCYPPAILLALLCALPGVAAEGPIDFARDVAPLLERSCLRCHQPKTTKGNVSLATATDLLVGGHIVPGKPDESGLLELLVVGPGARRPRMPKEGKPLTAGEVTVLRRWIAAGARWPKDLVLQAHARADRSWWALRPLAEVQVPAPEGLPKEWTRNPIDRLVLAQLRDKGLTPSPPADPRVLIRRLTYDLTGLPPTPERVATFVSDPSPAAYAKLVDELLASSAYGERWGRHWLDVVRFGESTGYERNILIDNAWPFRDYVIRSFNDDKPFDRLVLEHLAGDVLGPGDPAVEVGTTFLVCGAYDNVKSADPVLTTVSRVNALDDMIRATGEAFLGMTVGCARCHDHKFDPITQQDYYRFHATLAGVVHGSRVIATPAEKRDHAAKLAPLHTRRTRLLAERGKLVEAVNRRAETGARELEAKWVRPAPDPTLTEDRFQPTRARHVRLTVLARDDRPDSTIDFGIDEFEVWTAGGQSRNVALAANGGQAEGASRKAEDFDAYSAKLTIDGEYGAAWVAAGPTLTITLARPETIGRVVFSANRNTTAALDRPRRGFAGEYLLETSLDGKQWLTVAGSFDRQPANPALRARRLFEAAVTEGERSRLADLAAELASVDRDLAAVPPLLSWWVGRLEKADGPFFVFPGGDPLKKADPVAFGSLSFLADVVKGYELPSDAPEAKRRLALARWIVAPDNPLTPRVLANRLWHYHFGTGIVDTPSDFGFMGGKPTHPELLDWLARQVRVHGWRLKPLHRLIVTSQTYQQSSRYRAEAAAVDGDSRLLWRFPPRRLSGEEMRDAMLAVAGKLDRRMGGPGFRLYRYLEDNVATYVPLDSPGPETYRRAVYHQNARAAHVDLLSEFDCPDPAGAAPRRAQTITPLQALTLLNHRFTLDMAEALAERLQRDSGAENGPDQVRRAFTLAYSRLPTAEELARAEQLIQAHGLRAFCRAVLNASEFLYLD